LPPTARAARTLRWLLWPAAAVTTLALVGQASYASFSAKVSNTGNSFSVGSVTLTDDDAGSALLSLTNLKPGSNGLRCIAVTSSGTVPSVVKLYATDVAVTKSLSTYINLTITQGTGATFGGCSGFTPLSSGSSVYNGTLAGFTGSATSYTNGAGVWGPSGNAAETRSYQFAYAVIQNTPDAAQGGTAAFGLTWEAQST
jgi:predicted ribosomally synthesized peptide with SipW-like signal peptide